MHRIDASRFFRTRWGDYALTVGLAFCILGMLVLGSQHLALDAKRVRVYERGRLVEDVPLSANTTCRLCGGRMAIEIRGGGVRVVASDCPNRVCMRAGRISSPGEMLVCAPNQVLVEIDGERPAQACDAVSY